MWLLVTVAACAAFGAANGYIIHRFELEPVVVTLASGFILTGAALLILPQPGGLQSVPGTSIVLG
ncbi:hypothetical protein [Aeromicrobium sp. UC242_57]|uniref:hypothetical protein n=1 Tax=Aeromicrobium sp. UC242_57 TaxID=3374624 RepID=UPI0037A728AE